MEHRNCYVEARQPCEYSDYRSFLYKAQVIESNSNIADRVSIMIAVALSRLASDILTAETRPSSNVKLQAS